MFAQLIPFIALSTLLIPVPSRAVPGAAWIRRQEDAQSSLTLDPAVISHGLEQDGQGDNPDPGQVRSLTSSNNFINFCDQFLDQGVPLTNGLQIATGSCNQTPMGRIISLDLAPRCKFVFPKNGDESLVENQPFTVKMKILNLQTGNFVNANTNYYAAPQQVNDQGIVIGHSHIVIEPIPSLDTTEPLDPIGFAFFKGLNGVADGDNLLTTDVTAGLRAGVYRMCSINTAANHQPALVSNAQHGALDDCSYFTVKAAGSVANVSESASTTGTAAETASSSVAATATATASDNVSATAIATDSAAVTESASDSASATASDSTSDAATTDAPEATQSSSDNGDSSSASTSSTDDQSAPTPAPDANSSSDAPAPTATESTPAPEGNNGNGDNNNNNNGGNNGNNGGNNGNNNNGGNNGNDNSGGNGDASSSPAAPTDAAPAPSSSDSPAPSDNAPAPSDAPTPSEAPALSVDAPAPDASSAPAPDAAPSQGNGNGGADGNQGGNNGDNGNGAN